ncbi:acetate--CoA ligase family protein [Cupriavidus basilensis]
MTASVARHAPQAIVEGMLVAPMVRGGVEMIAGISRDPVFGPVVMVGMGGIHAEVLKDVAVQAAPVSEDEALRRFARCACSRCWTACADRPEADIRAAARCVARLSEVRVPPCGRHRRNRHEPHPRPSRRRGRCGARRADDTDRAGHAAH